MSQTSIYRSKAGWAAALAVSLTTFLVYLPALKNGFVNWDDHLYVYENPDIRHISLDFLRWSLSAVIASLWHPLTLFTFALDHAIWGLNPLGYHLTNVVLHTANTFLVFVLAMRLIECGLTRNLKLKTRNFSLISAFVTAILFGIHPIHVESVAWVSERKDVLCAFFYLLTLIVYLKYATIGVSKKPLLYLICLIFSLMALMSKPMAVSLPIVLLILDFYPLKRITVGRLKQVLIEKLPFLALSSLTALMTMWAHYSERGLVTLEKYPLGDRVLAAMKGYIFYLGKMVAPVNLAPFYPYPGDVNFFSFEYAGSLISLLLISGYCIWRLRRGRLFFTVWLYYLLTLLPVIGVVQVGLQAAADRYTYLPSLGPFLLAGLAVGYAFGRCQRAACQIAIVISCLLISGIITMVTVRQIAVWRDSLTLWSHEIRLYPDVARAYSNRGNAYRVTGDYKKAILDTSKAIELDSQYSYAYTERGIAYYLSGEYTRALSDLNRSIDIGRSYADTYNGRGIVYSMLGDYQSAASDFTRAIELRPKYAEAYYNRGNAYYNLGNYHQAVTDFSTAIGIDPQNAHAYYNRGMVYQQSGRYTEASMDYRKAAGLGLKEAQADLSLLQKANPGL